MMRAALYLCLALLWATNSLSAQNLPTYLYTIHVGAFVKTQQSDFDRIRKLGFLYAEKFDNTLLRVYMGSYRSEQAATGVLSKVKSQGYPDAYVTRKRFEAGERVAVIQIATIPVGEDIDWNRYAQAGPLRIQLLDTQHKLMVGPFNDMTEARNYVNVVRQKGFKDAFAKTIEEGFLSDVGEFETGGPINFAPIDAGEALASVSDEPIDLVEVTTAPTTTEKSPNAVPKDVPTSYDVVMPKSPSAAISLPNIRKNVKRNSVYELQMVLKSQGAYTSSLDGYYGKGTKAGFDKILKQNRQLQKYQLLTEHMSAPKEAAKPNTLQYYVNHLYDQSTMALNGLEKSKAADAKAYRAYAQFVANGAGAKVDDLMNAAISQAFKGYQGAGNLNFDPKASYTYRRLDQLLQHLQYVQIASGEKVATPCWLFKKHPKEAKTAFSNTPEGQLRIQECDSFLEWPELSLLRTIAADLNPTGKLNQGQLLRTSADRAKLLLLAQGRGSFSLSLSQILLHGRGEGFSFLSHRPPPDERGRFPSVCCWRDMV